jgi:hypothetical protein
LAGATLICPNCHREDWMLDLADRMLHEVFYVRDIMAVYTDTELQRSFEMIPEPLKSIKDYMLRKLADPSNHWPHEQKILNTHIEQLARLQAALDLP